MATTAPDIYDFEAAVDRRQAGALRDASAARCC